MDHRHRHELLAWFDRNRSFSRELFDSVSRDAYFARPIPLRQPVVFYEGHFAAFNLNTLVKKAMGLGGVDEELEILFERGIDPETTDQALAADADWPDREAVLDYCQRADDLVRHALREHDLVEEGNPLLEKSEAVYTILEHEAMHHETLKYMVHQLPHAAKQRPHGSAEPIVGGEPPRPETITIPAGHATLGANRDSTEFGWDNEFDEHVVEVPAFRIARYPVTNRDYLEFVEAGGYDDETLWSTDGWEWVRESGVRHPTFWAREDDEWFWTGMYEMIPLPPSWPVWVTHAEAQAYANWKNAALPTEAQFHRAAYGTPEGDERSHPWGEGEPGPQHGNFDHRQTEPMPVDSHPEGESAWGVSDLVGNGWEWTSSLFEPFEGFREMPSYPPYSSDFFDGKHWVIKGASPATSAKLIRRSFRNWFRPTYPYVYAKFRLAC